MDSKHSSSHYASMILFVALLSLVLKPGFVTEGFGGTISQVLDSVSFLSSTPIVQPTAVRSNNTFVVSIDPLVIYIEGFVSAEEAAHVVKLAEPHFVQSGVVFNDLKSRIDIEVRDSLSAVPERDAIVRDIENRAVAFQGPTVPGPLEQLKVVRYHEEGKLSYHHDWFDEIGARRRGRNRHSSFFVYLEANCTGGGTHFPYLRLPEKRGRWCEFVDCDMEDDAGVTFRPIRGNAVFWQNLLNDGSGHNGVLHAGLPVQSGVKTGMNIWTLTAKATDI